MEGAKYGIYIATFKMGSDLIMYAVAPYTQQMVTLWIIASYIEFTVLGAMLSRIHQCEA